MSKQIKIPSSFIEQAKKDFLEMLISGKFTDGSISFSRKFVGETNKKANIKIKKLAWDKMKAIVEEFDSEVAWHGICRRGAKDCEYYIDDIVVYPQEVTGVTVNTDQERYQQWLFEQPDDVFNGIRMQGHSHVNMSTSPSNVDTEYYNSIVNAMTDDMFYIFIIMNKRGDRYTQIYDMKENTIFDTKDITVTILIPEHDPVEAMLQDARTKVVDKPKPLITTYNTYNYTYTANKPGSSTIS